MNVHAGRRETGVRLHRATLKKPNTSIASFLDSRLIFQSLFRAAYHVTVLQRPKPGQHSNTAGLMIKMKMGFLSFFFLFSLRRQAFVVLSYPCVCGASVCLIRINLAWGGLPSCVLRFMTLIWTLSSPQSRNSPWQQSRLISTFNILDCSVNDALSALWICGTRKGKVTRQKR